MPNSFLDADVKVPDLSGEGSVKEKFAAIENYLFLLLENLRYVLRNLSPDRNFNEKEWTKIEDAAKNAMARIEAKADENGASIEAIAEWQDTTEEAIAEIDAKADENGAFVGLFAEYYDHQDPDNNSAASIIANATNAGSSVKINADRINLGDSAYAFGSGKGLVVHKLFGDTITYGTEEVPGVFYLSLDTGVSPMPHFDLFVKPSPLIAEGFDPDVPVFKVSFGPESGGTGNEALNFYMFSHNFLGHHKQQNKTYPKGDWDFSSATVSGLGVVPVFG